MSAFFDTHAHLQDPAFAGCVDEVLARAATGRVERVAVFGYDLPSSVAAVELAARYPEQVVPGVGIHPHEAEQVDEAQLRELRALAQKEQVVAIGETGLDFYRDLSPRKDQQRLLAFHLELALSLRKPVSIHSRGAEEEIRPLLEEFAGRWRQRWPGRAPGVMHCFGGTPEQALGFVDLGFLVSLACVVTYPSATRSREVGGALPLEALLVETDSPYLPPQTHRGKRNEPAFVAAAGEAIGRVRNLSLQEIMETTTANAARLYGIRMGAKAGLPR